MLVFSGFYLMGNLAAKRKPDLPEQIRLKYGGDEEDRTYHRLFSLRKHLCVQVEIFSNKVYYSCARNYVREERYKSVYLNVYLKGTNFPNLSGKN